MDIVVAIIILIFVLILSGLVAEGVTVALVTMCIYILYEYFIKKEKFVNFIDDINIGGTKMLAEKVWNTDDDNEPLDIDINDPLDTRDNIYEPPSNAYLRDQQNGRYTEMIDDKVVKKQKQRGDINHRAITGSVTATRNVFDRYLREELLENEQREWYSVEADPSNDLFV